MTCSIVGCSRKIQARKLCGTHYMRWRKYGDPLVNHRPELEMSFWERFWIKVDKNGPISSYRPDLGPCWIWTSARDGTGYGQIYLKRRSYQAHRLSFEFTAGPIHKGLEVDHLCRVHECVNPSHLEPVTRRENIRRGTSPIARNMNRTHCSAGHEYTPENVYINPSSGERVCRKCNAKWTHDWYMKQKVSSTSK
jgi:hypothetical protein